MNNCSELINNSAEQRGHSFGTAPVFLASISTILGAIMFLRFGYAVANTGLLGAILIIILGHMVTMPTALALSEIATNRRVEGGGAYFIISRSFGITVGGAIGISLYFSQAISVAFYMIAFAEAFQSLGPGIESLTGISFDPRIISIPASFLLVVLVIFKGADLGVKVLWFVAGILALALLMFFSGSPVEGVDISHIGLFDTIDNSDPFIIVFAICFPAFTGMIAGVGLSGDLANPRKSIPHGILSATIAGMIIYLALTIKLAISATPEMLAGDQLIMAKIALWGPIIPTGLACATLSSAVGSLLVAPRTLQALARDRVIPFSAELNRFFASGSGKTNEPRNATIVTAVLILIVVAFGNVDFVARIISMFFMVTYGSLCTISFLEHFAARPAYRPSFRSRWYLSFMGALMCFLIMFQMDPLFALIAIILMVAIYQSILSNREGQPDDLSAILYGVMSQATRYMRVRMQKSRSGRRLTDWRPSIIMINNRTFDRFAPLQFLGWLSHRYGFGTYLHYIEGRLNSETYKESRKLMNQLIKEVQERPRSIYVDTLISPSMITALAQSLQIPGVSGMPNNTTLFEFSVHDSDEVLKETYNNCLLAGAAYMNVLILRHGDHHFGDRSNIHIWLNWHDYNNANLMILLSYILLAHQDWDNAEISIFAAFPKEEVEEKRQKLTTMVSSGRIPITEKNIRIIPTDSSTDFNQLVQSRSSHADLVIMGFTEERLRQKGIALFKRHPDLKETLFVSASQRISIE
jgi:solute carrier family 12 sodium/potassium/chloride transporter 2